MYLYFKRSWQVAKEYFFLLQTLSSQSHDRPRWELRSEASTCYLMAQANVYLCARYTDNEASGAHLSNLQASRSLGLH